MLSASEEERDGELPFEGRSAVEHRLGLKVDVAVEGGRSV